MATFDLHVIKVEDEQDVNQKYSHHNRRCCSKYVYLCQITGAISMWYISSILATVINKKIVSGDTPVFPLTLTFIHVFISSICDAFNMMFFHKKELQFYIKNFNLPLIVKYITPLAFAMVSTKLLTYISYEYIPVSLTHTVKALQPFFNVLIVYLWTGEGVNYEIILSLFPIVFGVSYASVTEIEFNMKGFISALISTVVGVWQSVYLKMLMRMGLEKNFIHWCNGAISWIVLLPIVIFVEYKNETWKSLDLKYLIVCSFIQYCSSIASYSTMSLVTSLSYSIASTFKRVAIILSSVVYFGKKLTIPNLVGITIASIGAIMYNILTKKTRRRKSPELKPHRELSYTDLNTITI